MILSDTTLLCFVCSTEISPVAYNTTALTSSKENTFASLNLAITSLSLRLVLAKLLQSIPHL